MLTGLTFILCSLAVASAGRLTVSGTRFYFDGQHVFLSGANLPWVGYYLGLDSWEGSPRDTLENELREMSNAGANSIRIWIHHKGGNSPIFDGSGYVTGLDNQGGSSFIAHFREILDLARQYNILVFPSLWNAAPRGDGNLDQLIGDDVKLQSYINNALTPWVNAVKDHPAFGGWDIINEPEAILRLNQANAEPCYDTTRLAGTSAGYADQKYTYQQLLRFINRQAAAIKAADPTALVTVGAWDPKSNADAFGYFNYYKDECLVKAGGNAQGTLDFWQFHNYAWGGDFDSTSVFKNNANSYNANKPILVGEFWLQGGAGLSDHDMFQYIYNNNYHGAWVLVHTVDPEVDSAISTIRDQTSNGRIPINI